MAHRYVDEVMIPRKPLYEKIKRQRIREGLTSADVARALGASQQNASRVVNVRHIPTIASLWRLAEVLNCRVIDLIPEEWPIRENGGQ